MTKKIRHSIVYQLFITILVVSFIITIVTSGVGMYFDYLHDLNSLNKSISNIEKIHLQSIKANLWVLDEKLLQTQMDGILNIEHIKYARIQFKDRIIVSAGVKQIEQALQNEFPLYYTYNDAQIYIGTLFISASLKEIYDGLKNNLLNRILFYGILVSLISLSIFFIFQMRVTKHLIAIADYIKEKTNLVSGSQLILHGYSSDDANKDELGQVVDVINEMSSNMQSSFLELETELLKRKEAEEKYKIITDSSLDIIFMVDKTGKLLFINESTERVLGYKVEEIIGKSFSKFVQIKETPKYFSQFKNVFMQKEIKDFITQINHKDGHLVDIEINGRLIKHKEKYVALGTIRDISERKRAEELLFKANEEYRKFFEDDLTGDFISTVDGELLTCNPAFLEIFEFKSKEEALDHNITELYFNKLVREELLKNLRLQKRLKNIEFEMLTIDGKVIHILENLVGVFNEHEELVQIRGYIVNVTDRVNAELESRKLTRAVEQNPASIIITDPSGNIEYVNPKFTEVSGYTFEEAVGKNPRFLQSGETSKIEYKMLWEKILQGKQWSGEFHNRKKNGELYWENAIISPMVNVNGDIINYVAIKEDLTENKRMIEELIIAKERAEKSDKLKSEFLAQMSHEIRTPINAIVGMTSLIKMDFEEVADEDQLESFDIVDRAGERIIRTIDLLINLSEIQAGTYEPNHELLDLHADIIVPIIADHKNFAKKKNIDFTITISTNETSVRVDSYTVNQIFSQLIDNALKFTEKGEVIVNIRKNIEGKLVVEIKDTGVGIEDDYLPELFEPFSQEEMGYSRKYDGNGIGLSLVKTYCGFNDAKIEVESEKEVGSTFRVIFN